MPPLLVINGSIGAGKTVVLGEISDVLTENEIAHLAVDFDALTQAYPRPAHDPFHMRLGAANLTSVWGNAHAAGAERLVVASVVENRDQLSLMTGAVADANPFVCRLRASLEVEQERVRRRETGSALQWHLDRARELWPILEAAGIDDEVVDTDGRELSDIAAAVLTAAGWVG